MKTAMKTHPHTITEHETSQINNAITEAWQKIAPFWPLKNLIAVNPLQGLENLPIEEAFVEGAAYFQQATIPEPMEAINRETIKWLQAFFDDGQATIAMPMRNSGLYASWCHLVKFDARLHKNDRKKQEWLAALPQHSEQAITECLLYLGIAQEDRAAFLTLLLATLSGWAAHIKYRTQWSAGAEVYSYPVTQADYLAVRLAITCLLWKDAKLLLGWHKEARHLASQQPGPLKQITENETQYRLPLLRQLAVQNNPEQGNIADAQLVFCIDVRSEPFRRALEATGNYETFGFAGFFGIPIHIDNAITGESYASCPVLLSPEHTIKESSACSDKACENDHKAFANITLFKKLYQSLKYNFTTPFALVETLGIASGIWMGLRSFAPAFAYSLKTRILSTIRPPLPVSVALDDIPFEDQCNYAKNALGMMGFTQNFAPIVVLCGHGSTTQNNAYATALDCGACGGRHGASNARVLATILGNKKIREALLQSHIIIPETTHFIAAEHNTTTDEVELYANSDNTELKQLKIDLAKARHTNSQWRCSEMGVTGNSKHTALRSHDWAQVRPEWGLARNAAFIIAPRSITRPVNLAGRSFLHSYDYQQDPEGASLTVILTAPMVVAQWINAQYLFSTLDNVAFGGGSKITKNITGKLGIMQGNASDLMTGLPLQSVYASDTQSYHELQRLMTVVYAPRVLLDAIIAKQDVLRKLFGNGWVTLACIDPIDKKTFVLERDLTWQEIA